MFVKVQWAPGHQQESLVGDPFENLICRQIHWLKISWSNFLKFVISLGTKRNQFLFNNPFFVDLNDLSLNPNDMLVQRCLVTAYHNYKTTPSMGSNNDQMPFLRGEIHSTSKQTVIHFYICIYIYIYMYVCICIYICISNKHSIYCTYIYIYSIYIYAYYLCVHIHMWLVVFSWERYSQ